MPCSCTHSQQCHHDDNITAIYINSWYFYTIPVLISRVFLIFSRFILIFDEIYHIDLSLMNYFLDQIKTFIVKNILTISQTNAFTWFKLKKSGLSTGKLILSYSHRIVDALIRHCEPSLLKLLIS